MRTNHLCFALSIYLSTALIYNSCKGQTVAIDSKNEKIEKLITRHDENKDFNGAIIVSQKGKIVYQNGIGFANMEWDIPNSINTKFRIGSISKQFTAMVILQLVSEGTLDLHEPISTYLPEYPKVNGDQITIHHLLTHSSGTPNNYESSKEKMRRPDSYPPQGLVKEFSSLALEFNPGDQFEYSNSGYVVLGLIIETVSAKKYEEVLHEQIFRPLGMLNTGFDKHRTIIKNRAAGYFNSWGEFYNSNHVEMSKVYAAGGLYSTVEDLNLWDKALYTEKLISKKYLDQVFDPHIADPEYGGHYGYGWSIKNKPIGNTDKEVMTFGHDGVIDGFCAIYTRIPSSEISIVVLSNVRRAPLNAITKSIMGILYDETYDFPQKSLAYAFFEKIESEGYQKGLKLYEALQGNKDYYKSENEINIISYRLLKSNRPDQAAKVLELGIAEFPKSFNLYDSLGEVLRSLGQIEKSIENYKKSIELNPGNKNGIKILQEMGVKVDNLK